MSPPTPPPEEDESAKQAAFRTSARKWFQLACVALTLGVAGAGGLGWHFGHWLGLASGLGLGLVVAVPLLFVFTMLFGMSQGGG